MCSADVCLRDQARMMGHGLLCHSDLFLQFCCQCTADTSSGCIGSHIALVMLHNIGGHCDVIAMSFPVHVHLVM